MNESKPDTYDQIMADMAARIKALPQKNCHLCDGTIWPNQRAVKHPTINGAWLHGDYQECEP